MKQRWYVLGSGIFVALCCLLVVSDEALAQKERRAKPREVTVIGTVQVIENDDGKLEAIRVSVDDETTYEVILDERGEALTTMDGKKVQVTGVLIRRGKSLRLRVKSFREIKEEEKEEGGGEAEEEE
jgi:hypothetical protein